MNAGTIAGWKTTLTVLDAYVRSTEETARDYPGHMNRGARDAAMHAQQSVARKLAKMMLTGEEESDAESHP